MMRPLNDREWLEQIRVDMLGRSLADYDHATSLLDTLDQCDDFLNGEFDDPRETLREIGQRVAEYEGSDEFDKVDKLATDAEQLRDLLDVTNVAGVFDETQVLLDLRADLLVLLVDAGIAEPNVMPDDPISLLRMFLPVD